MKLKDTLAVLAFAFALFPASAADYNVDPAHTSVVFRIEHFGIAHVYGRFNDINGTFNLDKNIAFEIKTASIDTNNQKRDDHLRSPDFFNAKQFPVITFKSIKISKKDANTYRLQGEISIHGVTKKIEVLLEKSGEGKDPWGNFRQGLEASFTLKRSDFGMTFMADGIGDEVEIFFAVEGIKQ